MELEDAIRILNLSTPLFKHLLIVYNKETGMEYEVKAITTSNENEEPRIVLTIGNEI
jgi:hypothetical protein